MFERQRLDCLKATVFLVLPRQGNVAIALQRHHKVFAQFCFDQLHVVRRREPHVVEDVAEWHPVLNAGTEHRLVMRVLADGCPPLGLARLGIGELFVFLDQGKGHRQRHFCGAVERRQEIDAFDAGSRRVVVVPADQLALVGVRFMRNAIVHDQYGVFALHLPHQRLDDLPQVCRCVWLFGQEARDLASLCDYFVSWLRCACKSRESPVAMVGPNEEIR